MASIRPTRRRRTETVTRPASFGSRLAEELKAWIKPIVLIGGLVWAGQSLNVVGGPPSFEAECERYIEEFHPPVSLPSVLAFLRGQEKDEQARALFLTHGSLIYFDGEKKDDASLFQPRLINLSIGNIERVRTEKQGFFGIQFYIYGKAGETIQFKIPNRKYADFFLERLKDAGGPVRL